MKKKNILITGSSGSGKTTYAKELVLNLCSHHKTDLHVYSSKYSNQWDNLTEVYSPLPTINENTFKNQTDSNIFSFSLLINTLHEIMIERKKNNQPKAHTSCY
jgi:uridine kinase